LTRRGTARRIALGVLAAAALSGAARADAPPRPSHARAAALVDAELHVAFDRDARLGRPTGIALDLRVDLRHQPARMTAITILAPAGVDVATSGLGLATCRPSAHALSDVLVRGHRLPACPRNSVFGRGEATASLRSRPDETVGATGAVLLANGPPSGDAPGVVAVVDTRHPLRAQLVFAGTLLEAPFPFGLGIHLPLPDIPRSPFGAPVSLTRLRFTLGGKDIVYSEGSRRYRPGGLPLPTRCPRGGFRFRATMTFADDTSRAVGATIACSAVRRP